MNYTAKSVHIAPQFMFTLLKNEIIIMDSFNLNGKILLIV